VLGVGDPDAVDRASAAQRLADGVAPVDDHLPLRTTVGPSGVSRTS
jgi:hypothetical protein